MVDVPPSIHRAPSWEDIAGQYGLTEEFAEPMQKETHSIEDEFNAYSSAHLSSKNVQPLQFWQVSKKSSCPGECGLNRLVVVTGNIPHSLPNRHGLFANSSNLRSK